jgi:hypothetical protein
MSEEGMNEIKKNRILNFPVDVLLHFLKKGTKKKEIHH